MQILLPKVLHEQRPALSKLTTPKEVPGIFQSEGTIAPKKLDSRDEKQSNYTHNVSHQKILRGTRKARNLGWGTWMAQ